jgi:hypothetical protein
VAPLLAVFFRGNHSYSGHGGFRCTEWYFRGCLLLVRVVMLLLSLMTQHHAFLAYFIVQSEKTTTSQVSQIANNDRKERKLRRFPYNSP